MKTKMIFLLLAWLLFNGEYANSQIHGKFGIIRDDDNFLRGFLSIALLYGQDFIPGELYTRGLLNLSEAMNTYTDISTSVDQMVPLASGKINDYPVVFLISDKPYVTTPREREVLREYIKNGGFLVIDNPEPYMETSPILASAYKLIKETFESDMLITPLPRSHSLNYSFFHFFPDPPVGVELDLHRRPNRSPVARRLLTDWGPIQTVPRASFLLPPTIIRGGFHNNRLVALIMDKGYIINWIEREHITAQMKYGINILMFALMQEGGMASKLSNEY